MKRTLPVITALIITISIIFSAAGCACESSSGSIPISVVSGSAVSDPDALPLYGGVETELPYTDPLLAGGYTGYNFAYGRLGGGPEQQLYRQILQTALAGALRTGRVAGEPTDAQVKAAFDAVIADYPQLFMLRQVYTVLREGEGEDAGCRIELSYFYTSKRALEAAKTEFYAAVNALLAQAAAIEDEAARILFIHDAVAQTGDYSYAEAENVGSDFKAHTAYGCLVNKSCVCDGYAAAFTLLCNYSGIRAATLTGRLSSNNVGHAWNLVERDGVYRYFDLTLDDAEAIWYNGSQVLHNPADTEGAVKLTDGVTHSYYDVTYYEISTDHVFDADGLADGLLPTVSESADLTGAIVCDTTAQDPYARLTAALKAAKAGEVIEAAVFTVSGDEKGFAAAVKAAGVKAVYTGNGAGTRFAIYVLE